MQENLLIITLITICISIIAAILIVTFVETVDTSTERKLNAMNLVWIVLIIVIIISNFYLEVPKTWFSLVLILLIIGFMIGWHVALFKQHNKALAKALLVLGLIAIVINILYCFINEVKPFYIILLIMLVIWIACMAKITFDLTQYQLLSLS